MALNRDRVLKAAIRLADKEGIESLSMRKLAKSLGVEAMSLYNHVANKGDLVDAMVDRVIAEIELPDGEWEDAVRRCAISAHAAFVRHPWACEPAMSPSRPVHAVSGRAAGSRRRRRARSGGTRDRPSGRRSRG